MLLLNSISDNLKNYYRVRVLSKKPIQKIFLVPTYRCNLKCDFCYSRGLENEFKEDMNRKNLNSALNWLRLNRINVFGLLGGEPTEYLYFEELMDLIKIYKMRVILPTNNLFNPSLLKILPRKYIEIMILNYNKEIYSEEQHKRFKNNLESLKKIGFRLGLMLNINKNNYDKEAIVLAKYFKCDIRFTTSCPAYFNNIYVPLDKLSTFKEVMVSFVKECKENKVKAMFSRPIIPCMFNKRDLKNLKPSAVRYTCNIIPVVNPDLSIFACHNIFKRFPNLLSFKNLGELNKRTNLYAEQLRRIPLLPECLDCKLYSNHKCQGGCLSYKQYQ
ncbi:MAG: radical SAM protein [Candidatus Omnitrophota bacterium]|jgi:MoaA/NifB/PqqE/SkfB family radical SAM enzyme